MIRRFFFALGIGAIVPVSAVGQASGNGASLVEACITEFELSVDEAWDGADADMKRETTWPALRAKLQKFWVDEASKMMTFSRGELLAGQKEGPSFNNASGRFGMCLIRARLAQLNGVASASPPSLSKSGRAATEAVRAACVPEFDAFADRLWDETPAGDKGSTKEAMRAELWKRAIDQLEETIMQGTRQNLIAVERDGLRSWGSAEQWGLCAARARLAQLNGTAPAGGASMAGMNSSPNSPARLQECTAMGRKQGLSGSALNAFAGDCKLLGSAPKTTGPTRSTVISDKALVGGNCVSAKTSKGTSVINRAKTTFENKCAQEVDVYWCGKASCRTTAEFSTERLAAKGSSSVGGTISRYAACTVGAKFELTRTLLGEPRFNCVDPSVAELAKGFTKAPVVVSAGCIKSTYMPPNTVVPNGQTTFENTCKTDVVVWWCKDAKCLNSEISYYNISPLLTDVQRGYIKNWSTCMGSANRELLPPRMLEWGVVFRCRNTFHVGAHNTGNPQSTGARGGSSNSGSAGSPTAGNAGSPTAAPAKKRERVHNPALIAMNCVAMRVRPPSQYDRFGGTHFKNNCGRRVNLFYCPDERCNNGDGSSTRLEPGEETIGTSRPVTWWAACISTDANAGVRAFFPGTNPPKFQCFDWSK